MLPDQEHSQAKAASVGSTVEGEGHIDLAVGRAAGTAAAGVVVALHSPADGHMVADSLGVVAVAGKDRHRRAVAANGHGAVEGRRMVAEVGEARRMAGAAAEDLPIVVGLGADIGLGEARSCKADRNSCSVETVSLNV